MASGTAATVPGGLANSAGGDYSFAAGRRAKATSHGSFVWGDSTDADFTSTITNTFIIRATNGVGIGLATPGTALDVSGDIRASGCFLAGATTVGGTCSSDRRFKKNIQAFPQVLDKLAGLQPVSYDWRTEEFPEYHFGSARAVGLIAQEVEKVFPDMVSTDARGYKQVNYSELPYLMLQAIRELGAQGAQKDAEVRQLRSEMEELKALVARLAAEHAARR